MSTKKNYKTRIRVSVFPVASRPGKYTAVFTTDVLHASYCCHFFDDIMGAFALNRFSQMLEYKFKAEVIFEYKAEKKDFQNKLLNEILYAIH